MFSSISDRFRGTYTQILATITGTMIAVSDGMQYGWTAPVIPILLGKDSHIKITKEQTEWLETITMIGAFCGLPITIYLVDKIGRKNSILLSTVTSIAIWITIAVTDKVEFLLAARFLAGTAGDMAFVAAPMYIAEIANEKIRGFLSSLIYLMMLSGVVLVYCIIPFVPFYATSIIACALLLFELCTFPFMPDSPYYLLQTGRPEEARKALATLRQTQNVDEELQEITKAVTRQTTERGKIQDIVLVKSNRKALVIMTVLNGAQHLASISVILMNLHSILEAAGSVYISSSSAAIVFSLIMLAAATLSSLLIDNFGRKILLISSSTLTGLCLMAIAIYFALKNSGVDVTNISWIPIVSVMFYGLAFKLGLGMVPIVVTAEIFPAKMKAIGMTLSDSIYVIFAIFTLEIYHILVSAYGIHVPFFMFAGCCFFTTFFTIFFIPETKGKTLEEIQYILKGESYLNDMKYEMK